MKTLISLITAKEHGLTRYFTGRPCKRGHLAERFASTRQCSECMNMHSGVWKKANREKCSSTKREWRDRNREKVRSLKREYYAKSETDREQQAIRAKRWLEANREKSRGSSAKWRRENLPTAAAAQQRRKAKLLHCLPSWADHEKIRQFYILAKKMTDDTGIPHEVDHIFPLQGDVVSGFHVETNLRVIPKSENRSKGSRLLE